MSGHRYSALAAQNLAFHVVSAHANAAGIANSRDENARYHYDEHWEPCGIRNHQYSSLAWDENKLEAVLEEAEADMGLAELDSWNRGRP